MENSLLFIFDEIWPKTMYYIVQGLWPELNNACFAKITYNLHVK